jgi:sugar lactone lactonase YvrE
MRRFTVLFAALLWVALPYGAAAASPHAGVVRNFGPNLEATCHNPEGIAVDPQGNVYASSFAFGSSANICVLDRTGAVVDTITVTPGPAGDVALIGMLYEQSQGLYVLDFGNSVNSRVLLIDTTTHAYRVLADDLGATNALAQDRQKNLYVSDSFGGRIWKITPDGTKAVWAADPKLATTGFPPFGANGVAFDRDETALYVANTGDDRVLRIPVNADDSAGAVSVFADGTALGGKLNGADGIAFDAQGNLWVCANQANEIDVLAPDGSFVTSYAGTGADAFHFPASLVFEGRELFISNLAFTPSLTPDGVNSKVSVLTAPIAGAPLRP